MKSVSIVECVTMIKAKVLPHAHGENWLFSWSSCAFAVSWENTFGYDLDKISQKSFAFSSFPFFFPLLFPPPPAPLPSSLWIYGSGTLQVVLMD